jgi:GNAT superfamily N-acetyltransferase
MPLAVLREMRVADVAAVMAVQEPASIAGLSEEWGSGLARTAHDELLEVMRGAGVTRPFLRVYAANPRGRAFWEKLGWTDTGERSRGPMPPHAELLTYELRAARR